MNAHQFTNINELRGVSQKICHDFLMNTCMYALELVPTGFQIYALKSS